MFSHRSDSGHPLRTNNNAVLIARRSSFQRHRPHTPLRAPITGPRFLLHAEGAALLAVAIVAYWQLHGSWILFAVLVLVPDLSMIGYLRGPRIGASAYNAIHAAVLPAVLVLYWLLIRDTNVLALALIWFAHIGMDRMLGFGLKYETRFNDTHLQRV